MKAKRPLNKEAVDIANEAVRKELQKDPNETDPRRPLTMDSEDRAYRETWMTAYQQALRDLKVQPPTRRPHAPVDSPGDACPAASLADLTVRVTRTNDGASLSGVPVHINSGADYQERVTEDGAASFCNVTPMTEYEVTASLEHYTPVPATKLKAISPGHNEEKLELTASTALTVEVIYKPNQSALPGALVEVVGTTQSPQKTDAKGLARFWGLPPGQHVLQVTAAPYQHRQPITIETTVNNFQKVELEQASALWGYVTDSTTGKKVPDADIVVLKTEFRTKTDSDGLYRFDEIASGSYQVQAAKNGEIVTESATIPAHRPEQKDFQLALGKLIVIETKAATRAPFNKHPLQRPIKIGYRLNYAGQTSKSGYFSTDSTGNGRTSFKISDEDFNNLASIDAWGKPDGYAALVAQQDDRAKGRSTCNLAKGKSVCTFEVLESVAQFIVDEMNRNKNDDDVKAIAELNEWVRNHPARDGSDVKEVANLKWARKVHTNSGITGLLADLWTGPGGEWDHKPIIGPVWGEINRLDDSETDYYYDIWSNIHFGYVGRAAGFTLPELHEGANKQQWFDSGSSDDSADVDSITEGFKLYQSSRNVTVEEVLAVFSRHDDWEKRDETWAAQKKERERRELERQKERNMSPRWQ